MLPARSELGALCGAELTIVGVNRAFAEFFGTDRGVWAGRNLAESAHPDDAGALAEAAASLSGRQRLRSVRVRAADPERVRWLQWILFAAVDDTGAVTAIEAVGTDLSGPIEASALAAWRSQADALVARVSRRVLRAPADRMGDAMVRALRALGRRVGADTAALWGGDEASGIELIHGWALPGPVPMHTAQLQKLTRAVNRAARLRRGPFLVFADPARNRAPVDEHLLVASACLREIGAHAGAWMPLSRPEGLSAVGMLWRGDTEPPPEQYLVSLLPLVDLLAAALARAHAERRFRLVFDHAPIGMSLVDRQARVLQVNPALASLLGVEAKELIGNDLSAFTHPDDLAANAALIGRLRDGETVARLEKRYLRNDGSAVWAELIAAVLPQLDNRPEVALTLVRDVSEARLHAEALQRREAAEAVVSEVSRYLLGATAAAVPEAVRDALGAVAAHVGADAAALHLRESETAGGIWQAWSDPRSTPPGLDALLEAGDRWVPMATKNFPDPQLVASPADLPDAARWAGGWLEEVGVQSLAWLPLDPERELLGAVVLLWYSRPAVPEVAEVLGPLTLAGEAMVAALIRSRAEQRARAGEQRFRLLLQHGSDQILVLDPELRITYASPAALASSGFRLDELRGRSGIDTVHPEDRAELAERWETAQRSPGRPVPVSYRMRDAQGGLHWIEGTITNLTGVPGVDGYVVNGVDVTERHRFEQRLRFETTHDQLTGLANRMAASMELERLLTTAEAGSALVGVFVLDLDGFARINHLHGIEAGDQLLAEVGQVIEGAMSPGEIAARLAADAFVVLSGRMGSAEAAVQRAHALQDLLAGLRHPGRSGMLTCCIGVAMATPGGPLGAQELLAHAEVALADAARRGPGEVQLFDERLKDVAQDRAAREAELSRAIDEGQLVPWFQPIVDLSTGAIAGVEALARWQHPTRGLLAPAHFIPLAEDAGLVLPLGRRVLLDACRETTRWWQGDGVWVAVNISPRQLGDPDLVGHVDRALELSGLPSRAVALELTETAFAGVDELSANAVLEGLRDRGIGLVLDDFGSGYSSLGRIRRYPIGRIKIDRQYVAAIGQNRADTSIVRAVLQLGEDLGMPVVAEGVETPGQLAILRGLGCPFGQGYLFCPPAPPEEIDRLLAARARW